MRYVWLAVIVASAIPLVPFAWLANPLSLGLLGLDEWRGRAARLYPYRWLLLLSGIVCACSMAIYIDRWG